jgi:hydrogenase expression/formation protein HypE
MTDGERILLGQGSGGKLYRDLVKGVFVKAFANPVLERLDDAAALAPKGRIAFTTDSHVVQPLRFPGGDIGRLSVAGTVNDLATAAARPLALAAAFIIEEGFPLADLRDLCASAAVTAREAGVPIVTGDTKVVERGAADGLFITTTGVGEIVVAHEPGSAAVRDGDAVILSGSIGDHAVAILAARGQFTFSADGASSRPPSRRRARPAGKRLFASSATPRAAASRRCSPSLPRSRVWGSRSKKSRSPSRRPCARSATCSATTR